MTTSPFDERHHPRSTDGTFTTKARPEAADVTLTAGGDTVHPIHLEPGDGDIEYPRIVDATVMDSVSVYRDETTGHYWATGNQNFRYGDFAPEQITDEDAREVWGETHETIIDAVIEERYAGVTIDSDGPTVHLEFEYELGETADEESVIDKMSSGPAVDFYNEADAGTFGHEYLGRIIAERIAATAAVAEPHESRVQAKALRASGLVHESPIGEVTDDRAMAVAAEAAYAGDYPELRRLSVHGWGDHQQMTAELDDAEAGHLLTDGAVTAMRTWLQDHAPKR